MVLKQEQAAARDQARFVSIPKRVSVVLKPVLALDISPVAVGFNP